MSYELKMDQFSGPIHKLLELIEDRKMEINEISLGAVTEDFLNYVRSLENAGAPLLADFIAVASRLVFLKSKSLIPGIEIPDDEEGSIKDLEARLKLYQEFKPAIRIFAELWAKREPTHSRPYFLNRRVDVHSLGHKAFYPGDGLELNTLVEILRKLLDGFKSLQIEAGVIRDKIVTLEEKIQEIVGLIAKAGASSMGRLSETKIRSEIIVIFLAILHLAREQRISLEQSESFSDIMIQKL